METGFIIGLIVVGVLGTFALVILLWGMIKEDRDGYNNNGGKKHGE